MLGAVKVTQKVDFDRIATQEPVSEPVTEKPAVVSGVSSGKPVTASPVTASNANAKPVTSQAKPIIANAKPSPNPQQSDEMDRLGMGMRKMTFTQQSVTTVSKPTTSKQGISSTSYSNDHEEDRERDREIDDKLRKIDPSKGISSDMFFGKPSPQQHQADDYYGGNEQEDDDEYYGRGASYTSN